MTTPKIERAVQRQNLEIPESWVALDSIYSGLAAEETPGESAELGVQIISQGGVPRWVLPENTRRAVPVLRSWKPYKATSRLQWSAIVAACRINALGALPGVVRETMHCDLSYWRTWLAGFSDSWAMVAYIGNQSPTRKAILFFVDEKAAVRAVAKVPINPAAKIAVLNEANILTKLQGRLPVPQVLFSDERQGIAAQTWMEGTNVSRKFGAKDLELLTVLASESARVRLSDFREELEGRIAALDSSVDSSLMSRALSFLDVHDELRACVEHGDFAPWNLRRLADGQLTLIDWEWAVEAGLPWQDVCRYFYMQDYLFRESADVWMVLTTNPLLEEYCRRFELSRQVVRGLTLRYLLRDLCQEQTEGNRDRAEYDVLKIREVLDSSN